VRYDYSGIIRELKSDYVAYEDDSHIYFLTEKIISGQLLLEECNEGIIIWSNEIKVVTFREMYELLPCNRVHMLPTQSTEFSNTQSGVQA